MKWYQKYMDDAEWQRFYLDEARRKLAAVISDWENCAAEAMSRLFMKKLPAVELSPDGNHDGFVASVYRNALEDIRRELCGRPRPPVRMKNEGPPIVSIFELHCLDRLNAREISIQLNLPVSTVKYWTSWLELKKKCPKAMHTVSMSQGTGDGEYTMSLPDSDYDDPVGEEYAQNERSMLIEMIIETGKPSQSLENELLESSVAMLQGLHEQLDLSDQERLLLRLRHVEGLSKSHAAKHLGVAVGTFTKREEQVLARLRSVFVQAGFGV